MTFEFHPLTPNTDLRSCFGKSGRKRTFAHQKLGESFLLV
jgi:hypothetical protein